MEQNKLNLEDCCLTIEQTKELQALGIDFSRALMYYAAYNNNMKLWERDMKLYESDGEPIREVKDGIFIPTFTNTEMLEMLPRYINFNKKLRIYKSKDGIKNMWIVSYEKDGQGVYVKTAELLRDALFEMIKFLKKN